MRKRLTISFVFLAIGVLVYYVYHLRALSKNNYILMVIRNYVPDGLWTISFYLMVASFLQNVTKKYIVISAVYTFIISVVFEICQLRGIINGTFDYLDIIIYFYATVIACFIEKKCRRGNYEES